MNVAAIPMMVSVVPPGAGCVLCFLEEHSSGRVDFFVMGVGTALARRHVPLCLHHVGVVRASCAGAIDPEQTARVLQ